MAPITIPIRGVPVSALGPPYVGAMRSPDTLAVHVTLADGTAVCGRPLVWAKPASVISKRGLCTRCRRVLKRAGAIT
jgi:hypothetical protein